MISTGPKMYGVPVSKTAIGYILSGLMAEEPTVIFTAVPFTYIVIPVSGAAQNSVPASYMMTLLNCKADSHALPYAVMLERISDGCLPMPSTEGTRDMPGRSSKIDRKCSLGP